MHDILTRPPSTRPIHGSCRVLSGRFVTGLFSTLLIGAVPGCSHKASVGDAALVSDAPKVDFPSSDSDGKQPGPLEIYVVGFKMTGSNYDLWVTKFDKNGKEDTTRWNKVVDVSGHDIAWGMALDSDSNVYVVGSTEKAATKKDWLIKKYNRHGVEQTSGWNKSFDGGGSAEDQAYCVAVDSSDNVYVAGALGTSTFQSNWWIKKYDSKGTEDKVAWNKMYALFSGQPQDIAIDNGGIFVVGSKCYSFSSCLWLIKKFNPDGTEDLKTWNKEEKSGFTSVDSAQHAVAAGSGGLYVAGYSDMKAFWIKSYDATGTELWSKLLPAGPNTKAQGAALDSMGNLFVVGSKGTSGSDSDAWIKKLSSSGVEDSTSWNKAFSIPGYSHLMPTSVAIDHEDGVYVAISSQSYSCFLKKYDAKGKEDTVYWNKTFSGFQCQGLVVKH